MRKQYDLNIAARIIGPVFLVALPATFAVAQSALPTDPTVISGDIGFALPNQGTLAITQSGNSGIINWGSFSIGSGNSVTIQNGTGATLNRVTGNDPSQILGTLDATGSVYLLNQHGVFFGENGVIRTGGDFVASTLDISNSDFLNGGDTVFEGDSDATILNFGKIGSLGGNVALIARHVTNEGSLDAPNGTAALVAGSEVLMRDIALDNGMFVVRVGGEDTSVTDKGSITAAAAELRANGGNIYALAGNTNGVIRATGVKKKGGRIFLTAGGGNVQTTKTIAARRGNGAGGDIIVNAANIEANNLYDASASSGKGGFVELYATAEAAFSGQILAYGDDVPGMGGFAEVSGVEKLSYTGSTNTGGGTLLLDPDNIEITSDGTLLAGSSTIDPSTITMDLLSQSVIIQTTGTDGEAGTIVVNEELLYDSPFDLTFLAHGDLLVRSSIINSNTTGGDINLVSGWDGSTSTANFDPSVFDNADLANPVIFGNFSGDTYNFFGTNFDASGLTQIRAANGEISVGSVAGDTRVYSRGFELVAIEDSGFANGAMLGARVDNSFLDGSEPITGNITLRARGSVEFEGGNQEGGFTQIGHVGSAVAASGGANSASAFGDILVEVFGDISLDAGSADGAYAMIGHGSVDTCAPIDCNQSAGTRQGDITVFAGGEISLDDDLNSFGSPPNDILAWIGHGTADLAQISNADIIVEADSLDQNAFTNIASGANSPFNPDIITQGLLGGSFTLATNDTGISFGNNTTISATDGTLVIDAANNLQFGSGSLITDDGAGGQYALSAGDDFFNVQGSSLFDIGSGTWFVYSSRPDQNTGDINSIGGLGTVDLGNLVYNEVIDPNDPFLSSYVTVDGMVLDNSLNTLIYSSTIDLSITPTTHVYGEDASASPIFNFTVDGVAEDPNNFGITDITVDPNTSVVTFSPGGFVNVGTYTNGMEAFFEGNWDSIFFEADIDFGDLTVTPATLTVNLADETKNEDESTGYTGIVSYTGFVSGDSDALITSGPSFSYTGGDGSEGVTPGIYTVSGSGTTESSGNYIFDEMDTASLTIEAGSGSSEQGPTEEPTPDLPELPTDLNPTSINNKAITPPVLLGDGAGSDENGLLEVSTINTDNLVNQLQRGQQFCEGLAQGEYVIDCMGDSLQKAADGLPEGGDYAAVRAALEDASAKLAELARQNASTSLTRGLVQANGQQSSRRFTPVATEALAALNAQASAIIDEAQTILLRSAQNSERRRVHYQRIAEAVGSNKILLRS